MKLVGSIKGALEVPLVDFRIASAELDGTFLDLLHEGQRGTGTFYSEEAARFDDTPTRGYVVVGPKNAVDHAAGFGAFDFRRCRCVGQI